MKNTFGSDLSLTIFGESHGRAVGAVLDGMAAGVPVDASTASAAAGAWAWNASRSASASSRAACGA